jgi:multiple sugar transport system permease protein/raffinose/stachyose/melibiose transport system permease protein
MRAILENKKYIFIFTFPALLLFFVFVIFPIFNTFYLGMQDTDGIRPPEFVGFANFVRAFEDPQFIKSNWMSIGLALLCIICDAIIAVLVAIVLTIFKPRFQKYTRTAFLIPMVLSVTVISELWKAIYNGDWGLLNKLLDFIGLDQFQTTWLANEKTAIICVAIVGMWQFFGLYVMLAFAGIKQIPDTYYEAAQIDGAGFWRATIYITLPLLRDVIKLTVIMALVGGLYTFPQVYVMTKGGPGNMTMTIMMYIYKNVFNNQYYGYGSALAGLVIIETFILLFFINKVFTKEKIEF